MSGGTLRRGYEDRTGFFQDPSVKPYRVSQGNYEKAISDNVKEARTTSCAKMGLKAGQGGN